MSERVILKVLGESMTVDASDRPIDAALELKPWLEGLTSIESSISRVAPLREVLDKIAETTCSLFGYDYGVVLLVDTDRELLRVAGTHGLGPAYEKQFEVGRPIQLGEGRFGGGPSSRAFASLEPVISPDCLADPTLAPWLRVTRRHGIRSMVSMPLIMSDQAIGTLNCFTRAPHDFSSKEVAVLRLVANQAAVAIAISKAREQERETITRLDEARQVSEEQAQILEWSERVHARLTRVVLEDSGLESVAAAIEELFGGTVVIDDGAGTVLAGKASEDDATDGGLLSALPDDGRVGGPVSTDVGVIELPSRSEAASGRHDFIAPVVIGGKVGARLYVLGSPNSLGPKERRALDHAATVVALELLKTRISHQAEDSFRGELLDELLAERTPDEELVAWARRLGHVLGTTHATVAFVSDDAPGAESAMGRTLLAVVRQTARRMRLSALVGMRAGTVVAYVASPDKSATMARAFADAARRDAIRYGHHQVIAAIGPWAGDRAGMRRSFRIARGAARLAQRSGRASRTVSTADFGTRGLLFAVDDVDDLTAFYERTLGRLAEYDASHRGNLTTTLHVYLESGSRLRETATTMGVHPNTVFNRLRRLESILETDLKDPRVWLELHLAILVGDILGRDMPVSEGLRSP